MNFVHSKCKGSSLRSQFFPLFFKDFEEWKFCYLENITTHNLIYAEIQQYSASGSTSGVILLAEKVPKKKFCSWYFQSFSRTCRPVMILDDRTFTYKTTSIIIRSFSHLQKLMTRNILLNLQFFGFGIWSPKSSVYFTFDNLPFNFNPNWLHWLHTILKT